MFRKMANLFSDDIESLPLDKNYTPSKTESDIVDMLFGKNKSESIVKELKDLFLIAILFFVFSLKNVDDLILKVLPITQNSVYYLIGVKTIAFTVLFWLVKNFYLSRLN
jgi:hypothetical protein